MSPVRRGALLLGLALMSSTVAALEPGCPLTDKALKPWAARLDYGPSPCGGSLIDQHWVVTARHCVDPALCGASCPYPARGLDCPLDGVEVEVLDNPSTFPVFSLICPTTTESDGAGDLALLLIQEVFVPEVRLPTLGSIDMTPEVGSAAAGQSLVSVGWSDGNNGHLAAPEALEMLPLGREAGVARLAAPGACSEEVTLGATQFLAVAPPSEPGGSFYGTQDGDSGGPLVRPAKPRPEVVGVASAACSNSGLTIFEDLYDRRCWIAETACGFYCEEEDREICWKRLLGGSSGGCTMPDASACKRRGRRGPG